MRDGCKYLLNPGRSASRATATRAPPTPSSTPTTAASSCSGCAYPVEETQAKIIKAGLPEVLAQRLGVGR